jgi:hypothetical protein
MGGVSYLLMDVEFPKDFGCIQQVGVIDDLFDIPNEQWKIEDEGKPVTIDEKQKR